MKYSRLLFFHIYPLKTTYTSATILQPPEFQTIDVADTLPFICNIISMNISTLHICCSIAEHIEKNVEYRRKLALTVLAIHQSEQINSSRRFIQFVKANWAKDQGVFEKALELFKKQKNHHAPFSEAW